MLTPFDKAIVRAAAALAMGAGAIDLTEQQEDRASSAIADLLAYADGDPAWLQAVAERYAARMWSELGTKQEDER